MEEETDQAIEVVDAEVDAEMEELDEVEEEEGMEDSVVVVVVLLGVVVGLDELRGQSSAALN